MQKILFSLIAFLIFFSSSSYAQNSSQWITLAKADGGLCYQVQTRELIEKSKIFEPDKHIFINIRQIFPDKRIVHELVLFDFKIKSFKTQQHIIYDSAGNYIKSYIYPYNWATTVEGSFYDKSVKALYKALTTKVAWDVEKEISIPLDVPLELP